MIEEVALGRLGRQLNLGAAHVGAHAAGAVAMRLVRAALVLLSPSTRLVLLAPRAAVVVHAAASAQLPRQEGPDGSIVFDPIRPRRAVDPLRPTLVLVGVRSRADSHSIRFAT